MKKRPKKPLFNKVNNQELKERLRLEPFKRITVSFYRYVIFKNPEEFRNTLYAQWHDIQVFGRTYISREGINAQISIPEHYYDRFVKELYQHQELDGVPIKQAVEDDGKSFYKLVVKTRDKIVNDGLDFETFDVTNVGRHLDAEEFNRFLDDPNSLTIDMRNFYESEIGHFQNALTPDVSTFRDSLPIILDMLKDKRDKKILLYCTGGIRCEKASAFLKDKGFEDVNQLHGGIIDYVKQVNEKGLENKFKGKNFVFDERLGERISNEVISECHQCEKKCDTHTNCLNDECHVLFIQCQDCSEKYQGCCSAECQEINNLPEEIKAERRREMGRIKQEEDRLPYKRKKLKNE